ncbi:MAG TPA: PspC domain-containing protein [Chitinophagales bacterium]|nr:PspC domain-containing protein [Chitinophagales bacterium]
MRKRLVKSTDKKIFGVCGGLADYMDMDPTLIRALFLIAFVVFGTGLLVYIVLAVVMPNPPGAQV